MNEASGKVLVVDDEEDILEIISYNLTNAGYTTETARNGDEAVSKARSFEPDLFILDIMMPNKNGFDTLKELRSHTKFEDSLVIFLTALGDEKSEVTGLNLGADDYIVKPIKPKLLLSRVNALFRRLNKEEEKPLQFGDLVINKSMYTVVYKGIEIPLAKKEFELLSLLASKPGRVFLRNEILNQVWGTEVIVGDRTIDVHIRKIRQKLGVDLITTVKGVGYKFDI